MVQHRRMGRCHAGEDTELVNDNDILAIIIGILKAGFSALGITDVSVLQSYQPTMQGVPTGKAVFIHKINAPRYGYPGTKDAYNSGNSDFDTKTLNWRSPTFQIDGLAPQDPTDTTLLTASDLVEIAADIMQFQSTVQTLWESGIGIKRISELRPSYFIDDRREHEQSPSFDFTISYQKVYDTTTPAVDVIDGTITGV